LSSVTVTTAVYVPTSSYACIDSLSVVVDLLRNDQETRHAYISLWDTSQDLLPENGGNPCLVSLFFRKFEDKLTLTATFRTHNAQDAWLKNFYGLMMIQGYVADRVDLNIGSITVFSHSISIDGSPDVLARAKALAATRVSDDDEDFLGKRRHLRRDSHGEFSVTVDSETCEIVVLHMYNGVVCNEYRGKTSEELEKQLTCDMAISLISHAMYLGREIAHQEDRLKRMLKDNK